MDPLGDWLVTAGTSLASVVRAHFALPWGMRIDAHGKVMLHVVVGGSCWVRGSSIKPQLLMQGDLAVLPHGDGHELAGDRATPADPLERVLKRPAPRPGAPATTLICGTYSLDDHIARPMLRALPKLVVLPASQLRAQPQLASVLGLLTSEIDRPAPGGNLLVRHLFDTLFVYLVRAWLDGESQQRSSWLSALRDVPISSSLAKMHAEPAKEWTVEALAREAGLSRAAFARRFAEALGEPPLTYLSRWRMGIAARMLVETDASVAEVASRVGYESEFAFSRAFKRIRGKPPSTFRHAVN